MDEENRNDGTAKKGAGEKPPPQKRQLLSPTELNRVPQKIKDLVAEMLNADRKLLSDGIKFGLLLRGIKKGLDAKTWEKCVKDNFPYEMWEIKRFLRLVSRWEKVKGEGSDPANLTTAEFESLRSWAESWHLRQPPRPKTPTPPSA